MDSLVLDPTADGPPPRTKRHEWVVLIVFLSIAIVLAYHELYIATAYQLLLAFNVFWWSQERKAGWYLGYYDAAISFKEQINNE